MLGLFGKDKEKKPKRPKSKARKIIEWVLVGIFGAIFAFAAAATIDGMIHKNENYGQSLRFGVGTFVVQTDSMEPEYKVKSAIVTYKKPIEEIVDLFNDGQKVDLTFVYAPAPRFEPDDTALTYQTNASSADRLYGTPMTHRLREVHIDESQPVGQGRYILILAGINDMSGEWKINQYQVVTEQYVLGQVVMNSQFLGGVFGFIASPLGLFALLLIPAFYLVITSVIDIFRTLKEGEAEEASSGAGPTLTEEDKARLKQEMLTEMFREKQASRKIEQAPKIDEPKKEDDKLAGISDEDKARLKAEMLAKMQQEKKASKPKEEQPKSDALSDLSPEDKARLKAEMLMKMKQEEGKK